MARYYQLRTGRIAIVSFVVAVVTFIIIVGIQVLYFWVQEGFDQERIVQQRTVKADRIIVQQETRLQSYGWVSKEKGQVEIPIDRAMRLVLDDLQMGQETRQVKDVE